MKYHINMIKMKRKGLSAKGITIITLVLIIALGIATAVVTIFALSGHTMLSSVKISYTATDIDGSASVTYQLLSEDGTNDGEVVSLGSIEFKANNTTNPTQNLSPAKTLELSTTQPYVEFTYTFNNTGSLDYIATLTFVDVIQDTNIGFDYKYKEYDYGTENFAILVQGVETSYSQATYKVKMKVEDIALDANWNGVFNWELKAFEADTIEEQKSVRAMDYTENGSGTYTANYNGGKLENNTLVISGNVGGIKVTSVGQVRNLPANSKVVIGEGITSLENDAFKQQFIADIELPESLESIGNLALDHNSIKSVVIPSSVTEIGDRAFTYCTNLEEIIVDENNSVYRSQNNCLIKDDILVAGCKTSVIPTDGSVTVIGARAFNGCWGLENINIPNTITTIKSSAFEYCSGLTSLIIPSSVTLIEHSAFILCFSLESITVDAANTVYRSEGNCLIKDDELILGCKNSIIPTSVTTIGMRAFYGCTKLISITIPNNVTAIGDDAFYSCYELTKLIIPISVIKIESNIIGACKNLKEVYILTTNVNSVIHNKAFNIEINIYCAISSKPAGWSDTWAVDYLSLNWGYTGTGE